MVVVEGGGGISNYEDVIYMYFAVYECQLYV